MPVESVAEAQKVDEGSDSIKTGASKTEVVANSESASVEENVGSQISASKSEDVEDVSNINKVEDVNEDADAKKSEDVTADVDDSDSDESEDESDLEPALVAESRLLKERLQDRRRKEDDAFEEELKVQLQKRKYVEPKPEALKQKLHDLRVIIPEDVRKDWIERLVLVTAKPLEVEDPNDDLGRESAIYKATLECVVRGIEKVKHLDKLKMRPCDFFADMVKSDRHMKRIKARVLSEKKAISIVEQRRQNRGGKARKKHAKKQMRGMQIEIERKRTADAKQNIRALKDWRKDAERNEDTLMKAIKGTPRKKRKTPNIRRIRKNQKWGKGGIKRFRKMNTRESINDPKAFNPYVHGGKRSLPKHPKWKIAAKRGVKHVRPGKEKRRQTRFKRRRKK